MASSSTTQPALHPALPDFTQRLDPAALPEWMDGACTYEQFRDCLHDIAATTRLTRAYHPTLDFMKRALQRRHTRAPMHVVDVGSGGGDMLRHLALWARRRRVSVHLTGIDKNPFAARAATSFSARDPRYSRIHWLTGDVFTEPVTQTPALVVSSLVTHHMEDQEIVRFLRWMEEHAQTGWFVSDLVRSATSYRVFSVLARVMRWHPFVRHDGLVSIRRGFREADWERLLQAAEVPRETVEIRRCALGRICLTRLR